MGVLQAFSRELEELVARCTPAVVGVEHRRAHGSGVVLSEDGYVLTNAHVVDGAASARVRRQDGDPVGAEVVGADERTDLAVLRAEAAGLAPLALAPEGETRVGQLVVAIGNPLRFERSVSLGVVSAVDRSLWGARGGLDGLVQTDAAINPGNSGGPLVNMDGQVVGINTAMIPYAQGIGFAIPAHTASWVAAVLIQRGRVDRPYLGIAARSEPLDPAAAKGAGQSRALRVLRVEARSPASTGGLHDGDLLLSVEGRHVSNVDDLQRTLVLSPSPELRLDVWRRGRRQSFAVRPTRGARAA